MIRRIGRIGPILRACASNGGVIFVTRFLLSLLVMVLLTGCRTATFYGQAVAGQWELWARREPVMKVREKRSGDTHLVGQLELVERLCCFAEEFLGLPGKRQYRHYVELDRPYVVWNVFAAPEFSLKPKSWNYPVVGRLDYRGYFRESLAADYAGVLSGEGWDVYVGGVDAYSTLGWFRDPVLSTFVDLPELDLADLIFHELAHQRLFLSGDTDVNEAFATVVAREGVRLWLHHQGREGELAAYLENTRRDDLVVGLIYEARSELESLYAQAGTVSKVEMRRRKEELFRQLRERYRDLVRGWTGYRGYDRWMAGTMNNAKLNALDAYARWVPAMECVLQGAGGLEGFYGVMDRLGRGTRAERRLHLEWFVRRVSELRGGEGGVVQVSRSISASP